MKKQDKKVIETHGKEETLQPTTLEQLWGFNELAKYNTVDEDVYLEDLKDMNRTDLEAHARKVGVVVVESSARLIENLRKEFMNYKFSLYKPANPSQITVSEEVKKILAEGMLFVILYILR